MRISKRRISGWIITGGSLFAAMIPISVILGINKMYNKIRGVTKK